MLFLYLVAIFLPIPGVCIGSAPMDVGTGAFSPDGSLFQLEYACAAADRGSLAIGVEAAGAVVLVCARGNGGDDLMASSLGSSSALDALRCPSPANRKLVAISPTIGCAAGGLLPDSRVLIASARSMASDHWFAFGEPPSVASVAAEVGVVALSFSNHPRLKDHPKEKAPLRMSRPFGASLLLAAVEDEEGDADEEECSTEEEEEEEEECSANENDQGGHEQAEREGGEGGEAAMQRPTNLSASRSSDDGESDGGGNTDERRAPLLPPRRRRQRRASGRLYHLPPTGAPMRWRAKAIGSGATAAECDVAAYLLACARRGTLSLPASEALLEEKLDPPPPPPFASAPPQQQQQQCEDRGYLLRLLWRRRCDYKSWSGASNYSREQSRRQGNRAVELDKTTKAAKGLMLTLTF
mmetsp:Transcript_3792/g.8111  ORF Transcript_3792/g.8111 Transcript_3792/m.8111 type:complete len:411 (-) Transcript_3792:377-1609(-)